MKYHLIFLITLFSAAILPETSYPETSAQVKTELEITANAVVASLSSGEKKEIPGPTLAFLRRQPSRQGMFISIFDKKTRKLRGCMGSLVAEKSNLYEEVVHWSTMAMMFDQRGEAKLNGRKYAVIISFIQGAEAIADPAEVNSIEHGLMVRVQGRQELVLPGEAFTNAYALKIISAKFGFAAQQPGAEYFRIYAERFGQGITLFKKFDGGYGG
jgi:AMMECR1 domain-containing protein